MYRRADPSSDCCPSMILDNMNSKDDCGNGSSSNKDDRELVMSGSGCCCARLRSSSQEQLETPVPLECHRTNKSTKPSLISNKPQIGPYPPSLQLLDYVFKSRPQLAKTIPNLLLIYCFVICIVSTFVKPSLTSVNTYQNALITQPYNKNSGQYHISQLCSQRSPFPITRRVEGAVLSAGPADTDLNCTVTFRTKSAQQHFVIRFEELKLSCDDHLILFDGDLDYGQQSIKDFSCRDNMASAPPIKTTGTFLTMRYSSDGVSKLNDGFRLVVTSVFDISMSECPPEYVFCRSQLCISRSLFCDGVNHCLDNSDEIGCNGPDDAIELPYALGFFVMLILIISTGVIVCIILHCRRDQSPYAQYQHQLQRAFNGRPLQPSSSLMFSHYPQQPPYQYFQPPNVTPYITPQHFAAMPAVSAGNAQQQAAATAAMFATLPRGYSTLPLNLVRGPQSQQVPTILTAKTNHANNLGMMANNHQPQEYLMMTGLAGSHLIQPGPFTYGHIQQAAPVASVQQHTQNLANSQSILSSSTATGATTIAANRLQQRHMTTTPPSSNASAQVSGGTLRERTGSGQ